MRRTGPMIGASFYFLLAVAPAHSEQPTSAPAAVQPFVRRYPWDSDDAYATRKRLAERIPSIKFDATPFDDALEELSEVSGQKLAPNWPALEAAAIGADKEVTIPRIENVTLAIALGLILYTCGGGETELEYVVEDSVVRISTMEELSRTRLTHVYDCADLLNADEADLAEHIHRVLAAVAKYCGRDLCNRPTDAEGVVRQVVEFSRENLRQQLVTIIEVSIDPESWRDAGGNVGSIQVLGDRLVVCQTPKTHERIYDLLEHLRAPRSNRPGAMRWP